MVKPESLVTLYVHPVRPGVERVVLSHAPFPLDSKPPEIAFPPRLQKIVLSPLEKPVGNEPRVETA